MAHRISSEQGKNGGDPAGYIEDWDEYFLQLAMTVSRKSKDPNCRVGAVIVSPDKIVRATGFNGLARGVFDSESLLTDVEEKLKWICHAEINAIFNAVRTGISVVGCMIFVNKFPCFACCNAIAQAGIKRICTQDHRYWDDDPADGDHTRKPDLLKQAGIEVVAPFHPAFAPLRSLMDKGSTNGSGGVQRQPSLASHSRQMGFIEILSATAKTEKPLAKAPGRRTTGRSRRRAS